MLSPIKVSRVVLGTLVLGMAGWVPYVAAEAPPVFIRAWGSPGSGDGQFKQPSCIALDSDGNVYVTDSNNKRIQKFDSAGTFLAKWDTPGRFSYPFGIAVDQAGYVYVADEYRNRVLKFDSNGGLVVEWGSLGTDAGKFSSPAGVAVDAQGHVYVVDMGNRRIQKFSSNGMFVRAWPTYGGPWEPAPRDIAVDADGQRVYVTDGYLNAIVEVYDGNTGELLSVLGSRGTEDGQFMGPYGVGIDSRGNLYVADYSLNRVQKFDSQGTLLTRWGSMGSGNGQFGNCYDVAVDADGNAYVLDMYYCRIQKFGPAAVPSLPMSWGSIKALRR